MSNESVTQSGRHSGRRWKKMEEVGRRWEKMEEDGRRWKKKIKKGHFFVKCQGPPRDLSWGTNGPKKMYSD